MTDLIKITRVAPLEERWVRLWFADGAVKDVDLGALLSRGGVFTRIRDDRSACGPRQPPVANHRMARRDRPRS
jgi:hypothetical protein